MVHHRQRLPLGLEAGDHLPRVHARLDDLQRHRPLDRLGLLGHEDHAHAAFADLLQQLVGADDRAGRSATGSRCSRRRLSRRTAGDSRKLPGFGMGGQHALDAAGTVASSPAQASSRNAVRSVGDGLFQTRQRRRIASRDDRYS